MILELLFVIFSYLFASIPFGLVLGKLFYNIDIRLAGSKNIGATNVYRLCGKIPGIITFLLDGTKGAIPVLLSQVFFPSGFFTYLVAITCLIGHIMPLYLKFKGGKGVATGILVIFVLNPLIGLYSAIVWVITFILFGYSSLASIVMCLSFILFSLLLSKSIIMILCCIIISCIIILKHKQNVNRLFTKQESRIFKKAIFKI